MEGDSWFNAFVPRTAKAPDKPASTHGRRESLLKQANVSHDSTQGLPCSVIDIVAAGEPG